jgi:TQXA domain-containing protein
MRIFERSTAWVLVLCLMLSLALSVGPVAPEAHAAQYDPYAFTLGPGSSVVPSYYDPYANPFVGWSAHEVGYYEIVRMFNLTNVSEILPTKPENFTPGYASFPAFCCDHGTPYRFGSRYRMLNFEDAYFSDSGDYERAKHVRAIIRNSLPYYKDASVVQKAANEYFGSQVVKNLTSGEMAAAAQAAVWTYTNDMDYGPEPYFCTVDFEDYGNDRAYGDEIRKSISTSSPLNVY